MSQQVKCDIRGNNNLPPTVRSEGGSECRQVAEAKAAAAISAGTGPSKKRKTEGDEEWEGQSDQGASRI